MLAWENSIKPDRLYERIQARIDKYRESSDKKDYTKFRTLKRILFLIMPNEAEDMISELLLMAGWDTGVAMRFAKLS